MNLAKPYQNITYKVGATNSQLQRAIEAALPAATAQMKEYAKNFKGISEKDTCQKIFNFLMQNIRYKVDGDNQKIKLPSAFIREKEGDCKSYSLFTASILANLKIPFSFTYASYNPKDHTPEHIYVTTKNGCIIDAVWGKFNSEKKPSYKFQKPMNISYISGIKDHNPEKINRFDTGYHLPKSLGKKYSPSIGAITSNMGGIGRTGYDWAKAVGIDKYYSETKWYVKNLNPANIALRLAVTTILSKNGGGLANYLWSISPFNDIDKEDTTKKALYFGELEIVTKELMKKYNVADEKVAYNPSAAGTVITTNTFKPSYVYTGPLTVQYTPTNNGTTFTPEVQYAKQFFDAAASKANNYTKELEAAKLKIYAKYPYIISRKSTQQMRDQYRKLETWYFWELGGSPDDLNDAIKEGNTKTPTGETFNYYIRQKLEGRDLGVGLLLRASISAIFGYKYDPSNGKVINPSNNNPINGTGRIGVIEEILAAIIAWIANAHWIIQTIIGIILLAVTSIIALYMFAPRLINKWFDLKEDVNINTNGKEITPDPNYIDPKLKTDALESTDFSSYLIPAGIAAAFLFLSK